MSSARRGAADRPNATGRASWPDPTAVVQESSCAASWTALSTSFLSTCSSLATFFCAFSSAFST